VFVDSAEPWESVSVENKSSLTGHTSESKPTRYKRWYLFLACAGVVLIWSLTLHQLKVNREAIINGVERDHINLTAIIADTLHQILEQRQAITLLAQDWLQTQRSDTLEDINRLLYAKQAINRIAIYSDSGDKLYQSSPRADELTKGPQILDSITDFSSGNKKMAVINGSKGSSAFWQVPLLFPVMQQQELQALLLLELDLGYLLDLFQNLDLGDTGHLFLLDHKGDVIAGFEHGLLVKDIRNRISASFSFNKDHGSGIVRTYAANGGFHVTYRKVTDYPLMVAVTQGIEEIFSDYKRQRREQLSALALITLIAFWGAWQLLRILKRNRYYLEALQLSHDKNQQLIQRLEHEHEHAVNIASYDPLTNLYNRRLFVQLVEQSLKQAKRNGLIYALVFIDLDRFKSINDTFGHEAGDLLLQEVARRLADTTRDSDILARFGGDEFVVLLTEMVQEEDVGKVADKIIQSISVTFEISGQMIETTPSLGIAVYPNDGDSVDTLMRNADAAMYQSKRRGRGCASFFDASFNLVDIDSGQMAKELSEAISGEQLRLFFQPETCLAQYKVISLEALVRWQHPTHGEIYPSTFIPVARSCGLICDLESWVLNTVCSQMREWYEAQLPIVPVSVNVSVTCISAPGYAESFMRILKKHEIQPSDIVIEINEQLLFKDQISEPMLSNMQLLKQAGAGFILDGAGYHIEELSVDCLSMLQSIKIDRRLIRLLRTYPYESAAVSSVISKAKSNRLKVSGVGVENEVQLTSLKMSGCDCIQGYYVSKPRPQKEAADFLTPGLRSLD
jgi:diguanylate cyclase (GGDEF)-like protein